jgi:hypothetical protein
MPDLARRYLTNMDLPDWYTQRYIPDKYARPEYDPAIHGPMDGPVSGFLPPPHGADADPSAARPGIHHRELHNHNRPSGYIPAEEMAAVERAGELERLLRRLRHAQQGGMSYDQDPAMPIQDQIFRRQLRY